MEFMRDALQKALSLLVAERPSEPCSFLGHALYAIVGMPKAATPPVITEKPGRKTYRLKNVQEPEEEKEDLEATLSSSFLTEVLDLGPYIDNETRSNAKSDGEYEFPDAEKLQRDWRIRRGRARVKLDTAFFPFATADMLLGLTPRMAPKAAAPVRVPPMLDFTKLGKQHDCHDLQRALPFAQADDLCHTERKCAITSRVTPAQDPEASSAEASPPRAQVQVVQTKVFFSTKVVESNLFTEEVPLRVPQPPASPPGSRPPSSPSGRLGGRPASRLKVPLA